MDETRELPSASEPSVSVEIPKPIETFTSLKSKEIKLIASNPTREQLRQLASARAKARDKEEYKGGFEKKDLQWARRLNKRYERAYILNEYLKEETVKARSNARWGNEAAYDDWQRLKKERDKVSEKLNLLSEPFNLAGLRLDQSQIPPTFTERMQTRVGETAKATGETLAKLEKTVSGAREKIEAGRLGIVSSVREKILSLKSSKDQLAARLDQLRTNLSTAAQAEAGEWKREISELSNAARIQTQRASEQAVSSVRNLFESARQKAGEVLGPFAQKVEEDKKAIREKAGAASEQLSRAVEANKELADEILLAVGHQASEKAGAALGLGKKGLDGLRKVGGVVVNEYNERVGNALAEEFHKRQEILGLRVQSAKRRLNRMLEVYGDAAGPKLKRGQELATEAVEAGHDALGLGEKGVKAASELVRNSKESVVKAYGAISEFVANRAVELWSKTEGLSKVDIAARAALLKARLASIAQKAGEAAAFGVAGAGLGVEAAVKAMPESTKGRFLLVGGVVGAGALAFLAANHPDVFNVFGQLAAGQLPGAEQIPQMGPMASGAEQIPWHVPGVDSAAATSGSLPGSEAALPVAGPEVAGAVSNFPDFLNRTVTINPGDTLWEIVSHQTDVFGQWVNPENGVTKGDVVADIVRKYMEQAGQNPNLIYPGETFSLSSLNLSSDQLKVIQDALNSISPEQYQTEIMPRFEALIGPR